MEMRQVAATNKSLGPEAENGRATGVPAASKAPPSACGARLTLLRKPEQGHRSNHRCTGASTSLDGRRESLHASTLGSSAGGPPCPGVAASPQTVDC